MLDGWHVEFKLNKSNYKKAYIKINEQTLHIYDSIGSNNFFILFPLYKAKFEILKIKGKSTTLMDINELQEANKFYLDKFSIHRNEIDKNNTCLTMEDLKSIILVNLNHHCDNSELLIKFNNKNNDLKSLLKFLNMIESVSISNKLTKYISNLDETNCYIYGKMQLEIDTITIPNFEGNIFVNVLLPPYQYKTKSTFCKSNFPMKQIFLLPIHNRFEILKLEIYTVYHQGIFQKKEIEEKLSEQSIPIPDVINNFYNIKKNINIDMENLNKNSFIKHPKISMSFRIKNYSSLIGASLKNRNKNVLENCYLGKSEEDINLNNLFKRIKKVIILIQELKEHYKTLFRFKYPIYSIIICIGLTLYFLFSDVKYFITHLLFFIAFIIFLYSNFYEKYLSIYSDKYIF